MFPCRFADSAVLLALIALVPLAGCSGGGGGSAAIAPAAPVATTAPAKGPSGAGSAVTFVMEWAAPAGSAAKRRPRYLAPTALSASISVITAPAPFTSQTPIVEYLNSPSTTLTFTAPNGLDTFAIKTYDEQNGLGNVLSEAYVTQTVSGSSANLVSATLNGVISALRLGVSPATPTGGVASSMTVTATGLDADGNVIVGPGTYDTPIQLSIADPANSGTLTLSKSALQTPGATATLAYTGGTLSSATLNASANGATASATIAPTPGVTFITLPTANSRPSFIVAPAGSNTVYFTESQANKIGSITNGALVEATIPTVNSDPFGIALGRDGRIWFAEVNSGKIGAVTKSGVFTEFAAIAGPGSAPLLVADGDDGNMWFTAIAANAIGEQSESPSGGDGTQALPTAASQPFGIVAGPDGNMYFTELAANKIGRFPFELSTISEVALPALSSPQQIIVGPDGNLWFTENSSGKIGRLTPSTFTVTEFEPASRLSGPYGITVGADGALWFTEQNVDRIGRMTTGGVATDYPLGATGLGLEGITATKDGTIWFCANQNNQIGKLVY